MTVPAGQRWLCGECGAVVAIPTPQAAQEAPAPEVEPFGPAFRAMLGLPADADAAQEAPAPEGLRLIRDWIETRRVAGEWSGPPEWTAEDGYMAAVEEVAALVDGIPVYPGARR